ncbi:hypothetical protein [Paenibacillus glacialis]|nr:hypothetical protein [Paenibacillus glacialis]
MASTLRPSGLGLQEAIRRSKSADNPALPNRTAASLYRSFKVVRVREY